MAKRITLPYQWEPRPYQLPLWNYLQAGGTRAVWCAHRRSGKDELALRWESVAVMRRPGGYWHLMPQANQARRAMWNAVNPHTGVRRIHEAFPKEIVSDYLENEMLIKFINGSTLQFLGSDNYDALVGASIAGVTYSEAALADPKSWGYIRPILRENGGWALFISTPRGQNHFYTMYEEAKNDSTWFAESLPATTTGVFSGEQLETEQRELCREYGEAQGNSLYKQEYLCSFQSALIGAYWGTEMELAEEEGRICPVPHDPRLPVHTSWDLGVHDTMVCLCYQIVGQEIHFIDCIDHTDVGLDWFARELQKRDWLFGTHSFPHDVAVRELSTGRSRLETLRSLGIAGRVIPAKNIHDGINAVRTQLGRCWYDAGKCKTLVSALRQYRRSWSEERKAYSDRPWHDWTSHYADAMRTFAMSNARNVGRKELKYNTSGII